jgi:hypothetical protein
MQCLIAIAPPPQEIVNPLINMHKYYSIGIKLSGRIALSRTYCDRKQRGRDAFQVSGR